jgi:hypothetical protein
MGLNSLPLGASFSLLHLLLESFGRQLPKIDLVFNLASTQEFTDGPKPAAWSGKGSKKAFAAGSKGFSNKDSVAKSGHIPEDGGGSNSGSRSGSHNASPSASDKGGSGTNAKSSAAT